MENWMQVVGYEGYYEVSDLGRIRSVGRVVNNSIADSTRTIKGKIISESKNRSGYLKFRASAEGVKKTVYTHVAVAQAFLGHIPCGQSKVVHHVDNNPSNNKLSNLKVVTQRVNSTIDVRGKVKYVGVSVTKTGRYKASIKIKGKGIHLGYHDTPEQASSEYKKALAEINLHSFS